MKLSALTSNKHSSYYDQPSSVLIEFPLLNSPEIYSHAPQCTRNLSYMTLEGDTLLQIQKWQDDILYDFFQSLSKSKI